MGHMCKPALDVLPNHLPPELDLQHMSMVAVLEPKC